MIVDPTAFNLTITDLVDNVTEKFPNLSLNNMNNNYVANVVNDIDNGSQLVNVSVGSFTPNEAPPHDRDCRNPSGHCAGKYVARRNDYGRDRRC